MKTTILTLAALLFFITGMFYSNAGQGAKAAELAVGTITVCLDRNCTQPTSDTQVSLWDAATNTLIDNCVISYPNGSRCCQMTGNYPTGTYFIEYKQSSSFTRCTAPPFSYTNGTNVTFEVVCICP
jgi:hypothetical protein